MKKARFVAKGYSQKPGEDYTEVFSPVADFVSIRIILCLACIFDWEIEQMDVVTAFLNGDIDATIYINLPI
jgi:hypothetical protein